MVPTSSIKEERSNFSLQYTGKVGSSLLGQDYNEVPKLLEKEISVGMPCDRRRTAFSVSSPRPDRTDSLEKRMTVCLAREF